MFAPEALLTAKWVFCISTPCYLVVCQLETKVMEGFHLAVQFALPVLCCTVLFAALPITTARDIYVSSENGTLNSSCWNTGKAQPCLTLSLALDGMKQNNQTTVWIESGNYTLNSSSTDGNTSEWKYVWMYDLAIIGLPSNNSDTLPVLIECETGAGLSFYYSENIRIQGVELRGCGALHKSTSRNFTDTRVFADFQSTLYFLYCKNVVLENINIVESDGIGAVIYSTVGDNFIYNSNFSSNSARDDMYPGGGGLYIEFSYCSPNVDELDDDCRHESNVPPEYVSGATFNIDSCIFQNNTATLLHPNEHTFILPQLSNHLAFGRGGGMSVFFKGDANNNTVFVNNSRLLDNQALWGAGLFVEFQDMSNHNHFIMQSSVIDSNQCESSSSTGGGGARVGYIFFQPTHSHHNSMTFENVMFSENRAYYGGGFSFYVAREPTEPEPTNSLTFVHCLWTSNIARVGSAADLSVWHPVPAGAIPKPCFAHCRFIGNTAQYTSVQGSFVGIGALYVDSIPVQFNESVHFENNTETALASVSTGIYFHRHCSAEFISNRGRNGGAIALMGYAFIEVSEFTSLNFIENTAEIKGGAIYGQSIGEHDLISSRNCFIRYEDISATPYEWNSTFFFSNNIAGSKSNSIYVTSLLSCLWGGAFGSTKSSTSLVFCWNSGTNEKRWDYDNRNCTDEISTSPASFYGTNTHYNDSEKFFMHVIPGKKERLPIGTFDDRNKTVTNETVLFATELTSNFYIDSSSLYISDNQIELHGEPNMNGTLRLETAGPRVISTEVDVKLQPCPPGLIHNNKSGICICGEGYSGLVQCDGVDFSAQIQRGSWMGYWKDDGTIYAGQCPYCALITKDSYMKLSLNFSQDSTQEELLEEKFCGKIQRTGTLCGRCKDDYGPVVNGDYFDCKPCPASRAKYIWVFYLLTEFAPITIFFFIVVIFNVSATSGPANAFVFFAQVLTTVFKLDGDGSIQLDSITKQPSIIKSFYVIPYDIWNLNFFRPILPKFCLSPNISTLQLLSTGYITAFYPLFLVGIFFTFMSLYARGFPPIVCIFRPIHSCFARFRGIWSLQRSVLHALATFILLSYTKFTLVSFILLSATPLLDDKGNTRTHVVYYDGTIEFFTVGHIPYIVVSLLVIGTFVILPPIILSVPSGIHYIQKYSRRDLDECCGRCQLGPRWEQFLNAFHGCYKDGTGGENGDKENQHDFRWFAGLYFVLRLILFLVYAFTPDWFIQYVIQQLVCMCAFAAFMLFRPYKNDFYNKVDSVMFVLLAAISTLTMYNYYLTAIESTLSKWAFSLQCVLILVPLVYIIIYCTYYVYVNFLKNRCPNVGASTCPCFRGFQVNDEDEENQNFIEYAEQSGRLAQRELFDSDSITAAVNRNRRAAEENVTLLQEEERRARSSNSNGSGGYGATGVGSQAKGSGLNDKTGVEN